MQPRVLATIRAGMPRETMLHRSACDVIAWHVALLNVGQTVLEPSRPVLDDESSSSLSSSNESRGKKRDLYRSSSQIEANSSLQLTLSVSRILFAWMRRWLSTGICLVNCVTKICDIRRFSTLERVLATVL